MDPKETAAEMVRELIKEWGIPEEEAKDKEKENLWWFVQGSAGFHIQIFKFDKGQEQKDALEVVANIMPLPDNPEKRQALYQHVLDMNSTAVGVWFGVRNNKIMLFSTREVVGLDPVELRTMANDVRFYADHFDDIFQEKFGDGPGSRGPAAE